MKLLWVSLSLFSFALICSGKLKAEQNNLFLAPSIWDYHVFGALPNEEEPWLMEHLKYGFDYRVCVYPAHEIPWAIIGKGTTLYFKSYGEGYSSIGAKNELLKVKRIKHKIKINDSLGKKLNMVWEIALFSTQPAKEPFVGDDGRFYVFTLNTLNLSSYSGMTWSPRAGKNKILVEIVESLKLFVENRDLSDDELVKLATSTESLCDQYIGKAATH